GHAARGRRVAATDDETNRDLTYQAFGMRRSLRDARTSSRLPGIGPSPGDGDPPFIAASLQREVARFFARIGHAVAEADAPVAAQHQLLAPEHDFVLVDEGHVSAVGALVDDEELVAAPLDARVQPRSLAVGEHDVA